MDEKNIVKKIKESKANIKDIFFAGCGGSLNDLFPAHYFLQGESCKLHSTCIPARELTLLNPPTWNENSITFVLTHSGNTQEAIEAAKQANKNGSYVIVMTNNKDSKIVQSSLFNDLYIYKWGKAVSRKQEPMCMTISILNEYLYQSEKSYKNYENICIAMDKVDSIVKVAQKKQLASARNFSQKYRKQNFFYVLGSGANTSQAYGFAICSLMEMQWIDCAFINSAEFFHGPFEVLQDDEVFIQCVNVGKTRALDIRSKNFISDNYGQLEVIDAKNFGMDKLPSSVVDYFNPVVFYEMGVLYREELAKKRAHPTDFRQYMGKVDYSY